MENTLKTDVLIVGAGPTGLSLAAQLMRYNIDFVLVDQKETVTNLSKALVVHARTLEIFDQIGLARPAVDHGEIARKLALIRDGKVSTEIRFADYGKGLSPFPFVLIYEQSKTEQLLYDHLRQNGKDVRWQTQLNSLTQDASGVHAVVNSPTGETQTIDATYAVGCDGAGSPVRHLLNLGFEGSTLPRLFYVADVDMDFAGEAATLHIAFRQDSFLLMIPMEGATHWRLIGNMPEHNEQTGQETTYDEIAEKALFVMQRPLNVSKVRWFSSYKVHTRHAERFAVDRCFLAGDAAHIHTPAGGQGMNTGIQDAYNLAWKLALVLRGRATRALLASYNEERLANAKQLLKTTDQFFDAMTGDTWLLQFFRDNVFPGLAGVINQFDFTRAAIFPTLSQIGINYRAGSLSRQQGDVTLAVKAGDRMPYFLVDGVNLYDKLREPKFHLLIFVDGENNYSNLVPEIERRYGQLLDTTILPLYPRVVDLFDTEKPFIVLLRPDNYIGFLTTSMNPDGIYGYLSHVIGLTP